MLFAQVREDPLVDLFALSKTGKTDNKILCVTSGGCTIMSLLAKSSETIKNIDAIDLNQNQNYLCELKIAICSFFNDDIYDIIDCYEGNMEKEEYDDLLERLNISEPCKNYWIENKDAIYKGVNQQGRFEQLFRELEESDYDYEKIFNREYLEKIFGKNAVENSKEREFYEHFKKVIETYEKNYLPSQNYFYYQILNDKYPAVSLPPYLESEVSVMDLKVNSSKINYICDNFVNFLKNTQDESYTMINTSNLTDWLSAEKLEEFFINLKRSLCSGGTVVMRRLNGDYKLEDYANKYFEVLTDVPIDRSHFYSEVLVCRRK
jgi:S-adenosylmethionine:diacylglycerol 3-amino-3-carboxypropyl transferase